MGKRPHEKLLSLLVEYADVERLLTEHPEVSRGEVEALRARFRRQRRGSKARRAAGTHAVVVAHCDGASRGNPGPAAIGVVLTAPSGKKVATIGEQVGRTTNNVAEYLAVVRAARAARALGASELRLFLDSELLVFQLNGTYRVRAPHLRALHAQALEALGGFAKWSATHVPRARNARADALANAALDAQHSSGN